MAVPHALALDAATQTLVQALDLTLRAEAGSSDLSMLNIKSDTILVRTATELILGPATIEHKTDTNTNWEWREIAVAGRGLYRQGWSLTDRGYQFVRLIDFIAVYDAPMPDAAVLL